MGELAQINPGPGTVVAHSCIQGLDPNGPLGLPGLRNIGDDPLFEPRSTRAGIRSQFA